MFDPGRPLYYDLGLRTYSEYRFKPGMIIGGALETPVLTTFDEVWRGEKGNLPKVRTRLKHYLNETDTRIASLVGSSFYKLTSDSFGRFTLGYLEPMYAGFSAEFLRSPATKNLSYGLELNYVLSRKYRQLFETQELEGLSKIGQYLSSQHQNFSFIRLRDSLCSNGECRVYSGNTPLYIDNGHITVSSSRRNGILFKEHIEQLQKVNQ